MSESLQWSARGDTRLRGLAAFLICCGRPKLHDYTLPERRMGEESSKDVCKLKLIRINLNEPTMVNPVAVPRHRPVQATT